MVNIKYELLKQGGIIRTFSNEGGYPLYFQHEEETFASLRKNLCHKFSCHCVQISEFSSISYLET